MARIVCLLIILYVPIFGNAQFQKIKSLEVSEPIAAAFIDRPGDLYILTETGQIQKFDPNGILKAVHKTNPAPTLFDPRDGSKLFAFYRADRTYAYLTSTFEFASAYKIDSAFVIEPWLAGMGSEYDLWILDAADNSLKKIHTKTGEVSVDVKLNTAWKTTDIITMRAYQGFVFILVRGMGIYICNSIGKWIRTVSDGEINAFNFLGEELYYVKGENLKFFDLFSTEERLLKLPAPGNVALISDERLYMIRGKTINVYAVKP